MLNLRFIIILIVFVLYNCNISDKHKDSETNLNKINDLLKINNNEELELSQRFHFIDSLYQNKRNHPLDSIVLKILFLKSNLHYRLKEIDSSYFYDKLLLNKSNRIGNNYFSGKASQCLAYHFKNKSIYDSAYFYYNKSKNFFLNLNDTSQVGRRLMTMGLIQKNQSDFFGSKETLTEALEYLHQKKDVKYLSSAYNALATNHRKLSNYEDAIEYYSNAIVTTNSKKDKLIYKNNLSASYIDSKNYNKAIPLLESIIKDSLLFNDQKEYSRVLDNLAYAKWLSGTNITEAEFIKALHIRKQTNDQRGQMASYTHLGEFYSKTTPVKATAYFDSVIQLSKKLRIPRGEKDALGFLMKIDSKSVFIRDRYVFLQDSLYQQELLVKTQFAKYKYDDRLKQESILRLEKEKVEKDLEVSKQKNIKAISFFGIAILVLGLGFVSYFFSQRSKRLKLRNKTAKIEATLETEVELSRRIHDDFGAKLNHSMTLVQNNADKTVLLDTLDALYNQSRDFSREINEIDTEENYKNELFQMLSTYTSKIKLYTIGVKEIDWDSVNPLPKTVLHKVLRELMINMDKHSQATAVTITFSNAPKTLEINYSDNGVGASIKELQIKNGLRITENRIKAIGGTIIFDSEKEKGFKAKIKIPN